MNSQLTPLGVLIRTLRQNKGTTLYHMAKAIDLSPAQICAIEFGRTELTDAKAVLIADFICDISKAERVAIEQRRLENIANLQKIARQHD